jgi:exosome complex component CSL4
MRMSSATRGEVVRGVQPGDILGVEEEFQPGEGVYVDERGFIRAGVVGEARLNPEAKVVFVRRLRQPLTPKPGLSVVGFVTGVRHELVLVELYGLVSLSPRVSWVGEFPGVFTGGIPISQISGEFIRDVYEYFRVGDVVLARVLNSTSPYQLTTKPPQYGVIHALCLNCLTPLEPTSQKSMRCPRCGNVETRKVSILASSKILQVNIRRLLAIKRW